MSQVNLERRKKELMHKAVRFFNDVPCYEVKDVCRLQGLHRQLLEVKEEELEILLDTYEETMVTIREAKNPPKKIVLWDEGNMPSLGTYTENAEYQYNHDPDYKPYMIEMLVSDDITPKGAVVVCAGADHGDCNMHEGYQTCVDFNKLGYQSFLLLNRTNHCPYDGKEAGADAARAIQIVRKNAEKYRIDENRIGYAGFSNGALTGDLVMQYYSGTQKIQDHFPEFVPDETDAYYAGPDAFMCIYGPRFVDTPYDYTNVVYPPTFFAIGSEDFAMENFKYMVPELMKHNIEVEVHTFAGVPHGQSGLEVYGINPYPHFKQWPMLADAFMQHVFAKAVVKKTPDVIKDKQYHFDSFEGGEVVLNKKKQHLPAMGWNSWNAFGSGNTEALTKVMADKMVELGLDRLGYRYVVLDDGCYRPVREEGKLANEEKKFPSGFRALADYIHDKGLKFGMYNDIGTNLCAGASVGTCGHEKTDAESYLKWGVDFLKVDNCYYLWDNATFSDQTNAKYVYAPNIRKIRITGEGMDCELNAVKDGIIRGCGATVKDDYVTNIGTFDGTGPDQTPVGDMSGELAFEVSAEKAGEYALTVTYATDVQIGCGSWLQVAVGEKENAEIFYDNFLTATENAETFADSKEIKITLQAGKNVVRLMNHRRQENTLCSYAALLEGLNEAAPDNDIIFSICEWGKTQPQNWGYKVGDSWRILNDITFRVGADGDPGYGDWIADYTTSVTTQYSKAVIMDEFAGLNKGWNDPDMLMIGMTGMTDIMNKTHMTMWCMMNSPLMLGLDLRRVTKGDALYKIIANEQVIALNQDALGVQAKRIYSTVSEKPDTEYLRDMDRVDILAKPLADGSVAVSFINVSEHKKTGSFVTDVATIVKYIGHKMVNKEVFENAGTYRLTDLWTGESVTVQGKTFEVKELEGCDNITYRVVPV